MATKLKSPWKCAVLAATPMIAVMLLLGITSSDMDVGLLIGFALIGCVVFWIPLAVSYAILRLASWESRRAYLGVMFLLTFLPSLSVYKFQEFEPDMSFSYEVNDGGVRLIEFSIAGVFIALMIALLMTFCMWIFWRCTRTPVADDNPLASDAE